MNRYFVIAVAALAVCSAPLLAANSLDVNGSAALTGSFGLEVLLDSDSPENVFVQDDTPSDETVFRASFQINSNDFVGDDQPLNKHALYKLRDLDGPINNHLTIGLRQQGAALVAFVKIIDADNPSGIFIASNGQAFETNIPICTTTALMIEFVQGTSNDGIVRLYKNDVLRREHDELNNSSSDVDRVQLGALGVRSTAAPSGSYFIDDYQSFRSLSSP